jgi:hypothetical protein
MPRPHEIRMHISRERARTLIRRLAEDQEFREYFEAHARTVLFEHGIDVTPGTLPEQVTLPEPEAILEFLELVETRIAPEPAEPFGALAFILVFGGAMPVLAADRPALDGTG